MQDCNLSQSLVDCYAVFYFRLALADSQEEENEAVHKTFKKKEGVNMFCTTKLSSLLFVVSKCIIS